MFCCCVQLKKDTKSWIFIWKDFPLLLAWLLALFSTFLPTSCFCSRQQIDRKSCFRGLIMWLLQVFPFLASVFCTHKLRHFILEKDKPVFQAATEEGKEARKDEERRGRAMKLNKMKKKKKSEKTQLKSLMRWQWHSNASSCKLWPLFLYIMPAQLTNSVFTFLRLTFSFQPCPYFFSFTTYR